jgi:hypothetical protein
LQTVVTNISVLELNRISTHSHPVNGSGHSHPIKGSETCSINTLTACQGIRDPFGQQGSSSKEDQHTYILSRDQGQVQSARLKLDRGSTHSHTVKGSGMHSSVRLELARGSTHSHPIKGPGTGSVNMVGTRKSINTLTHCQRIRDTFWSGRLELDRGSTHSLPVKGSGTHSVSKARTQQRTNTLTACQGIRDPFSQRDSSSTEEQHTHHLSMSQQCLRSACWQRCDQTYHLQETIKYKWGEFSKIPTISL